MRETAQDLINEADILDTFCEDFDLQWAKLGNGGKYRIDAVLFRDTTIKAWVEVKDYKRRLFLGLNAAKYKEGCDLAILSKIPFLLIFRYESRVGYVVAHNGTEFDCSVELRMAGGTPKGREPLPDDFEPIFIFSKKQIKWLEKKT